MGIPNKTHCLLGLNNIVEQNKQASGRPHHITQIDLIICRVGSGRVGSKFSARARPAMWSGQVGFGSRQIKPVFFMYNFKSVGLSWIFLGQNFQTEASPDGSGWVEFIAWAAWTARDLGRILSGAAGVVTD